MTTRDLSRSQLEALLIARALIGGDAVTWRILRVLKRDRVSPAVFAILERLVDDTLDDASSGPQTKAEAKLAERVRAVTVFDALRHSVYDLIQAAKALPARPRPPRAWERDLDAGLSAEEAA